MAAQAAYAGLAALQLAGSYFASENIREAARLNQDIAEMNAEFAELDAYDALIQGETEATRYQSVIDNVFSEQTAIAAAQGLDLDFGTAASLQAEDDFVNQMNLMEIEKAAQEQALGFRNEASQFRMRGVLGAAQADVQAQTVLTQGITSAAQTGITGYRRSL